MSKRFECIFVEDNFGGTYRRLKDNETNITYMTCDVADLLNFQNTQIKILKEENEQMRNEIERLQQLYEVLNKLDVKNRQLREENIELKKLKKYFAEWMGVKEENLSLRCINMSDERFE